MAWSKGASACRGSVEVRDGAVISCKATIAGVPYNVQMGLKGVAPIGLVLDRRQYDSAMSVFRLTKTTH
jgi:hypothetical protein